MNASTTNSAQYLKWERTLFFVAILFSFGPLKQIFSGVDTTITGVKSVYSYYVPITLFLALCWLKFSFLPGLYDCPSGARLFWKCLPLSFMFFVDLVSCVWTNDPYESAKQIILLFICLMLCATTVARLGPEQSLKIIFEGLFAVCFASLLLVIFFPRSSIHNASDVLQNVHAGRWRGVFEHKNELGQAAALLSIVSITAGSIIAYSKKFRIVAIGLSLVLLFNAESASSNVSVAFAIIAYVFLSFNKFARVILGVAMVLLLFAVQLAGINVTATLAGLAGRDGSLTGRTEVWAYTLNRISQFWPFGLGYGNTNAFRTELQNNLGEAIVNSHNAFFEIALTTGLLGVVFLTVIIAQVSNWTLAFEARRDELGKASLILVLNWLFIGLTEDWTIQPNNVIFVSGIISFFILFSNQRRSAQTKAEVQTT